MRRSAQLTIIWTRTARRFHVRTGAGASPRVLRPQAAGAGWPCREAQRTSHSRCCCRGLSGAPEARGSKGVEADAKQAMARIVPAVGAIEVEKLTKQRIDAWLHELADAPRLCGRAGCATSQALRDFDRKDSEEVRRRRSTANRVLTILKAALNHAFQEGHVASDDAWRKVKPFREVDAAVVHFLSGDECRRLVNACEGAFRNIVQGRAVDGLSLRRTSSPPGRRLQRRCRDRHSPREQGGQATPRCSY